MFETLRQIFNACDPYLPASAEYYYDCAEARGSSALSLDFQNHLRLANDYVYFLFSGHIGCGKSSELKHLERTLINAAPNRECYFPIMLNVSEYLDDYDAAPTDILLAIVTELGDTMRRKLGIELKDNYFVQRLNEIKEFLLSDVEINEGELALGFAKAKIQRLKKDPTARQKVRAVLEPKMSTMLEEINTIFDEARLAVKKAKAADGQRTCADIVLILDNLEKIRKISGLDEGLASQRELFLERYTQLTGMKAHFIYTVPLRLVRSPDGPQLEQRYGPLFVLPMINLPITLAASQRAIQQTVRTYSTAIPESHWEKLARLDLSSDQKIPNGDNDYLVMLENLSVLEYINGAGDDPFALAEPWYGVNPIVRELQKFKSAVQAVKNERQSPDQLALPISAEAAS